MVIVLFLVAVVLFVTAYFVYGKWQERFYELDDSKKTPAQELYDGVDYVPAHPAILLGHHFSSIAGAGPIVGPITAASIFGWLPAYLWIVIGSIFFGGVHDMGAIVSSVRHKGKSIAEVIDHYIGRRAKLLFNAFAWFALILVVAAFLELAAASFSGDPAVAWSAVLYIGLAIVFGLLVYRLGWSFKILTILFVPILFSAVSIGNYSTALQTAFSLDINTWRIILIAYIFFASVLPVWILLQPRDYLSSWFLYASLFISAIGLLFVGGKSEVALEAFKGWVSNGNYLWPMLFITIACGAISGFHSLVGSGTTAKQLKSERDATKIGYGGMLLEGIVAVIALTTIMVTGKILSPAEGLPPNPQYTFAVGFAKFASIFRIPEKIAVSFGMFAINTFILTSLDTATRLARYQLEELSLGKINKYLATIITVGSSLILVFMKTGSVPVWKMIWPVFGSANQLTAGLALLGLTAFVMKGLKKKALFTAIPMVFMMTTTIVALIMLAVSNFKISTLPLAIISIVLIVLALTLAIEAFSVLVEKRQVKKEKVLKEENVLTENEELD
uniref:Carbon starvation protein A n=1 Tax=Fervidobacterium pennivorans TaxID=93466 RepID=A0A7V4KEZ3_FERPE